MDDHILTTDAEGNQILVQGTDQEQLQHLLQSVGVDGNQVLVQLQGNGEEIDGEGATLQMLGDEAQGQMILVQGADGESQLIDASMLQTEGGNLVLQQGADGQTHLTTADGIPVSVSFSGEGGEGHITVTMASGHEEGQQIFLQQSEEIQEQTGEVSEFSQAGEENSQESTLDDPLSSQEAQPEAEQSAAESVTSTTDAEPKEESAPTETTETPAEKATDEPTEDSEKPTENTNEEKVVNADLILQALITNLCFFFSSEHYQCY